MWEVFFCFLLIRSPIKCPECSKDYVRKTDRSVITRLNGHSHRSDQPMFQQPQDCETFLEAMT